MLQQVSAWLTSPTKGGLPLTPPLITSAIRSCWGSTKFSDKAARYFYNLFGQHGVAPDDVTFGALAGAFQNSPLDDVLWTYQEMKAQQVVPNRVFAEIFVASVLGGERLGRWRDPKSLAQEHLRYIAPERLEATRSALNDFESQEVELGALCRKIGKALSILGF